MRRAAALVIAALALLGCGGSDAPESTSSEAADAARAEEIQDLRRQVRELQREREPEAEAPKESTRLNLTSVTSGLDGEAAIAINSDRTGVAEAGSIGEATAWSTIKVPIALRVIEDAGGPGALSSSEAALIERAVTASDNEAAAELFTGLAAQHGGAEGAADAVTEILRRAGEDQPDVSTQGRDGFSTYGQTRWSPSEQAEFMTALAGGDLGSPQAQRYVLDLMGRITSDAWGLGSLDAPAAWKSGWGPQPDGGYLLRQMGVLEVGGDQVAVALSAAPSDGSFESGQVMMTEMASRLLALPQK